MQVASTFQLDIKSQIKSERRFRLKQTKCIPKTRPNRLRTGHASTLGQEEAQDNPPTEAGAVGGTGPSGDQPGRPTSPWAPSPSASYVAISHCFLTSICQGRPTETPWLHAINTTGGSKEWNTHTTPLTLLKSILA